MDSKVVLVVALALTGLCSSASVAPSHASLADEECIAGTGRDCLTVVKVIIIAAGVSIGGILMVGAVFLVCFMNPGRHGHIHREFWRRWWFNWFTKWCCCEPPMDDSLDEVIIDDNTSARNPAQQRTNRVEEDNLPAAAAADTEEVSEEPSSSEAKPPPAPLLSPSQIKKEPSSAPSSPKDGVAGGGAEAEPEAGIKTEPKSPQSYAEAAKTGTTPKSTNTSSSSRGDIDVTDTSTPNKSASGKRKLSLLSSIFGGSSRRQSTAESNPKTPTSPTLPISEDDEAAPLVNSESTDSCTPYDTEGAKGTISSPVDQKAQDKNRSATSGEVGSDQPSGDRSDPDWRPSGSSGEEFTYSDYTRTPSESPVEESGDGSGVKGGGDSGTSGDTSGTSGVTPARKSTGGSFLGRMRSFISSPTHESINSEDISSPESPDQVQV